MFQVVKDTKINVDTHGRVLYNYHTLKKQENKMLVERQSPFTGIWGYREIDVTPAMLKYYEGSGRSIQHVFPHLSADDREFIMTGITPDEFPDE